MNIINVKNVSFTYPAGVEALKNIDLEIDDNEIIVIIGQNGSGKTTLSKNLNGLLKPTKGEILINGVSTLKIPTSKVAKTVGYVFQDPDDQIFTNNVYDEVAFGPKNLKFSKKEVKESVEYALKLTGLYDKRKIHPLDLNLDERKLVAIATIIAMKSQVIILDEPTSGQDSKGIIKIKELIQELSKTHTILIISHNMELVSQIASRVIVMLNGEKLFDGEPKEVFTKTQLLKKTYLQPPLITQLAQKIGLKDNILSIEEFIEELKQKMKK